MGVCLTWFAVKGKPPESVRSELGTKNTGQSVSFPNSRSRIVAAMLPNDWYLVQRFNYECRDESLLKQLSTGCEVICLFVEEHVMFSRASGWKDGKQIWSIIHNSELGENHLETTGEKPSELIPIQEKVQSKRDAGDGDYFNIPCAVAADLTGYCYDASEKEQIIGSFEVLEKPSWLKKLFS
jgi:hypothetical protein